MVPSTSKQVYPVASDQPYPTLKPPSTSSSRASSSSSCVILDNGSTTLRAGYAFESSPSLIIDNLNARYRDRKTNRNIMLAGRDVYSDATSRGFVKTPFELDLVVNWDTMENMLDYVFHSLNLSSTTSSSIDRPIVMTEAMNNPHYSRSLMSELLFEAYGAPSVTYGIDSLFAFHQNQDDASNRPKRRDGLVISSGTSTTHVIPVLDGQARIGSAKKLNWGGFQATDYMLKLMQLKYPTFPGRLTSYQAGCMYRDHCYISEDYQSELRGLSNPFKMAEMDRIIQFPFVLPVVEEKTEEELNRIAEKKKEAGRRLQEQVQKQRLEKMAKQEAELTTYTELRNSKAVLRRADFEKRLKSAQFGSEEELDEYIKKIAKSLTKARNKDLGIVEDDGNKEPPNFPLVDVPDHTLNEAELKEKRRQRLMKAGYDARLRMKAEKEQERLEEEERATEDDFLRKTDFGQWLARLRAEHEDIMNKIKERKKRKEQLGDRKSLAAQNRMKSIANLASDAGASGTGGPKKRKRAGEEDDGFGQNDEDWAVYREIGPADDSDDEEDDQTQLQFVEARLLENDPEFTINHTAERLALRKHQLLNAFVRGLAPDDPLDTYSPESYEHNSQLHLNVERIRVPEVIWQPHMAGIDQAGLGEILENILKGFSQDERERLTQNVFVTGGNTLIPQFDSRLRATLRPILPPSFPLNIVRSAPDSLDAWRGMANWSRTSENTTAAITKADYEEYGAEYFKGHAWGNQP